jgi:hypothetical protein
MKMKSVVDISLHTLLKAALVRVSNCMTWVLYPLRSLGSDIAKLSVTGGWC